jgi:hypothetical protein
VRYVTSSGINMTVRRGFERRRRTIFVTVRSFGMTSTWSSDVKSRLAITDVVGDVDCRNGCVLDGRVVSVRTRIR